MKHFESFMAPQLQQYVSYRQALGYAKKGIKPSLLAFDRYLIDQNATWQQLQPAFFLQLRAKISHHPNTVNTILSGNRLYQIPVGCHMRLSTCIHQFFEK